MANPLSITFEEINAIAAAEPWESEEATAVQSLIDQAARKLLSKRRGLPGWIAGGVVTRDDVLDVVYRAVSRVSKNPDGIRKESEGTYSYEVSPLVASGDIWFPSDDLAQVSPASSGRPRTARVRLTTGWAG